MNTPNEKTQFEQIEQLIRDNADLYANGCETHGTGNEPGCEECRDLAEKRRVVTYHIMKNTGTYVNSDHSAALSPDERRVRLLLQGAQTALGVAVEDMIIGQLADDVIETMRSEEKLSVPALNAVYRAVCAGYVLGIVNQKHSMCLKERDILEQINHLRNLTESRANLRLFNNIGKSIFQEVKVDVDMLAFRFQELYDSNAECLDLRDDSLIERIANAATPDMVFGRPGMLTGAFRDSPLAATEPPTLEPYPGSMRVRWVCHSCERLVETFTPERLIGWRCMECGCTAISARVEMMDGTLQVPSVELLTKIMDHVEAMDKNTPVPVTPHVEDKEGEWF